jgi:hypothetical protein
MFPEIMFKGEKYIPHKKGLAIGILFFKVSITLHKGFLKNFRDKVSSVRY